MSSWKEKRYYLEKSIRTLSDLWGGDDPMWLKEYIDDVLVLCKDDIAATQECCLFLIQQAKDCHFEQITEVVGAE